MNKYLLTVAAVVVCSTGLLAEEPAKLSTFKHQVTGLFSPDRQQDLQQVVDLLPGVKLISVDFDFAEAVFEYDANQLLNRPNAEQQIERFDNLIRSNSASTFGIKAQSTTPRDKLQQVEIPVYGLDCKGCCLAAYESIAKIDGVEQATVNFREGALKARINPDKTNREQLQAALKQRGVQLEPTDAK